MTVKTVTGQLFSDFLKTKGASIPYWHPLSRKALITSVWCVTLVKVLYTLVSRRKIVTLKMVTCSICDHDIVYHCTLHSTDLSCPMSRSRGSAVDSLDLVWLSVLPVTGDVA